MYETNGKIEKDIKDIEGLRSLIGLRKKNTFGGAKTEEDLDLVLSEMSLIDLQKMAVSNGVSGGGNRTVLKSKIKSEFSKFLRGKGSFTPTKEKEIKLKGRNKKERLEKAHELMSEGL